MAAVVGEPPALGSGKVVSSLAERLPGGEGTSLKGASCLSVCWHDAASSWLCAISSIHPHSVPWHPLSCPWALHVRRDADRFPLGSSEWREDELREGEPRISLHLVPNLFQVPLGAHQLKPVLCLWGGGGGNTNVGNNLPCLHLSISLGWGQGAEKATPATLTKDNTSINLRLVHCLWETDPFARGDSN